MNLKRKIIFISIILLFTFGITNNIYADENITLDRDGVTEDYQQWQKLSDEEKKKYIRPLPFSTDISLDDETQVQAKQKARLKASVSDAKYSLKDNIALTVRNQYQTEECWAFTTTNLIATNLEKLGKASTFTLFSTRHMNYTTSQSFIDGKNSKGYNRDVADGGNCYLGLNYCTAGYGPVLETQMPFVNNANKIYLSQIEGKTVSKKVNEYTQFPSIYKKIVNDTIVYYNGYSKTSSNYKEYTEAEVVSARNKIKQQIMNYGAVSAYTYVNGTQYFDSTKKSYYCYKDEEIQNHAVTIVGWDDNYAISNFNTTNPPKHPGAYIVLNSHGANVYDGGYMYVSYDDCLIERNLLGVVETTDVDYDNIYQYDELGYSGSVSTDTQSAYIANVFNKKNTNSSKAEYLNEISVYVPVEQNVDIYANVSSDDKTKIKLLKSCGKLSVGYHTIKLSTPLEITGNKFVVSVKFTNNNGKAKLPTELNSISNGGVSDLWDTATGSSGQSYYSTTASSWSDLNTKFKNSNFCIKAFTTVKTKTTDNTSNQSTTSKNNVGVTYQGHVQNIGWQNYVSDGAISGTSGKSYRVEALRIKLVNPPTNGKIKYQSHVQNIGWQEWKSDGEMTGTSGKSYRVEALRIKLENMPDYTIQYRVHVQNIGWQDWKSDGEMAGTSGRSLRIEAIQIRVLKKCKMVTYQGHVQNIGWQNYVSDGAISGTSGKSLRVEALRIKLVNAPLNAKITYQSHVQNIGWQEWKYDGDLTGTSGKSYRVEALRIKLENMPNYTVQYRTHVQDIGWQDWKSDGEMAGTSGKSKRIEAIQIRILEKRNN